MKRSIKKFSDGSIVEYDKGSFDDWCVYRVFPNGERIAPRDVDYFTKLQKLSTKHGAKKIYDDFVSIYDRTTAKIDEGALEFITAIAKKYSTDALEMDMLLTIVYAGMVAEENKEGAKLKKKIKRLGMHQVLIENLDPVRAANFSKKKNWRELAEECRKRKF
jgi:hypothetical protein